MIPVPSYQLVPFLEWLNHHGVRMSSGCMQSERLHGLAIEFLQLGGVGCEWKLESLAGLMTIFQSCPRICEKDIEIQMDHFSGCGLCIEHIAELDVSEYKSHIRRHANQHVRQNILPIEKRAEGNLHPLIRGFVEWAREYTDIESQLISVYRQYRNRENQSDVFRKIIKEIGTKIREYFIKYLSEVRGQNPGLVKDYEKWRRDGLERKRKFTLQKSKFDKNIQPLQLDESLDHAAHRLVASVQEIETGFYDDLIAEDTHISWLFSQVVDLPLNISQAIEFLNWLRRKEPDLRIQGSIPSTEFEKLALQFCEECGYPNGQSFSKEARQWLGGTGSDRIINRIVRFLRS